MWTPTSKKYMSVGISSSLNMEARRVRKFILTPIHPPLRYRLISDISKLSKKRWGAVLRNAYNWKEYVLAD